MTLADRLATMFPGDPMLPAMVAACERDDIALAVYMKCEWLQALWTHPRCEEKHIRAFLRNPAWPARALELCHRYAVPAPGWVNCWAVDLAEARGKPPSASDFSRAKRVDKAFQVMSEPARGEHAKKQITDALKINENDARRLCVALDQFLDSLGFPARNGRISIRKVGKKTR